MQKALVLTPTRTRKTYQINCVRDGKLLMHLQANSRGDADTLSNCWNNGFSQGQMAEKMQQMGIRL